MDSPKRFAAIFAAAALLLAVLAGPAAAHDGRGVSHRSHGSHSPFPFHPPYPVHPPSPGHPPFPGHPASIGPLFVQTDGLAGNEIAAYDRAPDGTLTAAGTYPTGGLGGQLEGSVVDHLASQGSLVLDGHDGLLFAVNAGSNTVSVFSVFGDKLLLRQTISSGGSFPVSIAEQNGLVYVLNAEEGGLVQGFRLFGGHLFAIPGSSRALGLNLAATPQFVNTPGQVTFSPDGSQLLVTTKANGNDVDVFRVGFTGRLSEAPVVNELAGAVPFAASFDAYGHLLLTEAGTNALAEFALHGSGQITPLASFGTGQAATCWVVSASGRFYTSSAGSATVSSFQEGAGGIIQAPFAQTATDAGTVDAAVPADQRFLYVQAGALGIVDEYAIAPGGGLSPIGSVTVPGAVGGEGIVAP
jgi:hypothetical protein